MKHLWMIAIVAIGLLIPASALAGGDEAAVEISLLWLIPFAGMLLSIAILPMVAHHWWESNRNQFFVSLGWATPVLVYFLYLMATGDPGHVASHGLSHAAEEFASFIALLGSLFVIAGGIVIRGDLQGKPLVNTAFLAIGSFLSNIIGTTGASMVLIYPMLKTNSQREFKKHIPLFFIFIVSNISGALTPIGDPPLFLGYLRGVPFWWPLQNLWHIWLMPIILLLGIFFLVDTYYYRKEDKAHLDADAAEEVPLSMAGKHNWALLAGVVAAVLFLSPEQGVEDFRQYHVREVVMGLLAAVGYLSTSPELREANNYSRGPILEVAALFFGIFVTMIPATILLQQYGTSLGLSHPWQYFWATGILSSFLDNAPTYVTFAALACANVAECTSPEALNGLATGSGQPLLVAISLGAVFMGAMSYIGNGPNFMVRAIAEESGYKMPSFFGYIGWSTVFLVPIFLLVTVIFLM